MEENKNSINETKQMLQTSKEQIEALRSSKEDTANSLKSDFCAGCKPPCKFQAAEWPAG